MKVEQEQRITEDARRNAEQDARAQRYAVNVLEVFLSFLSVLLFSFNKRRKVLDDIKFCAHECISIFLLSFISFFQLTTDWHSFLMYRRLYQETELFSLS